jgi:uncharacterized protein (DUF1778 family)
MPTDAKTKPLKITNGRANLRIAVLPSEADLLERAAGQEDESVTAWSRKVLVRVARRVVGVAK